MTLSLSVVVVVHDMPDQAERTLRSLSPELQRGALTAEYEIVVVENDSPRLLGEARAKAAAPNVRYLHREDGSRSPVQAVNAGAAAARGEQLAIMVDGARLVTPGVVALARLARGAARRAVLSVPGYHLGSELQQRAAASGYDSAREAALLARIGWPEDGHRLFEIACLSGSCAGGFLAPFAESNFLCLPRELWDELGGFDAGFALPGGGFSNLDLYARVCAVPDVTLFVAPGEGTFHQFHGGVTTGGVVGAARDRLMTALGEEYRALRGVPYALPTREALLLGGVPKAARRFLAASLARFGPLDPADAEGSRDPYGGDPDAPPAA